MMPTAQLEPLPFDEYVLKVNCINCGLNEYLHFTKGRTVNEHLCPICGCDRCLRKEDF